MYDVLIFGGGLGGLALARHLRRTAPALSICVVERDAAAWDPTRRRVGESTVEISSWYLEERLGLADHLVDRHLVKFGLRFFLARGATTRLEDRDELGPLTAPPEAMRTDVPGLIPSTYQLHRGRIAAWLVEQCRGEEIDVRVAERTSVEVSSTGLHAASIDGDELRARWLVDATGSGEILRERSGTRTLSHEIAASWAWFPSRIDVDQWVDASEFHRRSLSDVRWRSTNHLLGTGYWVWLIPVVDGSTSVGVVVDPRHHDPARLATPDAMHAWLREHEPQCADAVAHSGAAEDFRAVRIRARRPQTLVSAERWAVTGDAGTFLDPLYSSGLDLLAIANELIVPAIVREDDRSLPSYSRYANGIFQHVCGHFASLYEDAYALLGDPTVLPLKVVWDMSTYFGYLAAVVRNGRIADLQFMQSLAGLGERVTRLNGIVQGMLRAWSSAGARTIGCAPIDYTGIPFLLGRLRALRRPLDTTELREHVVGSVACLEQLAVAFAKRIAEERAIAIPDGPLDPYRLGPDPTRWTDAGVGQGPRAVAVDPVFPAWLHALMDRGDG